MTTPIGRSRHRELLVCCICEATFRRATQSGPPPAVCSTACARIRATQRTRQWRARQRERLAALGHDARTGRELADRLARVLAEADPPAA